MDFTWKQNRLSKDKEALKNSMLNVIRKKPKEKEAKNEVQNNDQGYGATAKKEERGAMLDAGAQQSVPDPYADTTKRASAAATKQTNHLNRGSEFKKTAQ
jgi:hypothetical protein